MIAGRALSILLFGGFGVLACARAALAPASPGPDSAATESARTENPGAPLEKSAPPAGDVEGPEPVPLAPFPSSLRVGSVENLPVPNDRSLRLAHAPAGELRALVYLHGMCSDTSAAEPWFPEATRYGTVVALRADVPCEDRPGYKWPKDPALLDARITRALARVREERGGHLDVERPVLIGYSQGAHRAELLTAAFPGRFPRLVLGGPPEAALPEHFAGVERVAFLGGEKEDTSHMVRGQRNLDAARIPARFFLLPRAPHGSFGPRGTEVMRDVFEWLFADGESPASVAARR